MIVNVKLDITGSKSITFENYKMYFSCLFVMAQLNKRKLAILAFLYCGEFVKTSSGNTRMSMCTRYVYRSLNSVALHKERRKNSF